MKPWGICLCLALFALILPAHGADLAERQAQALEIDQLEDMTRGVLDGVELTGDLRLEDGLSQLLARGTEQLGAIFRQSVRSGGLLLLIVLFCGTANAFEQAAGRSSADVVTLAGAAAIAALAAADVHSLIGLGRETIGQLDAFSKALLPTVAAAATAGGAPTGATVRQMGTLLFSDVLITAINRLMLPLVYAYVAACTAYAAVGNQGLKEAAALIKWVVTSVLTGLLLIFVGYLTVSGAAASGVDAMTVKAAKTAISGMVPVVGGILSDATETVLAGAGVLKNAVGVFGMLGVLAFCLIPFLRLGMQYLIYKGVAAVSVTMAEGRIGGLISGIGGAFGLVLGMTGACALLLLVSLVSSVMVVVP